MTQCPVCKGVGTVMAFWDSATDGGYGPVKCFDCAGSGEVDAQYPARKLYGRSLYRERAEKGLSFDALASALGVSVTQLSALQQGRIPDAWFPASIAPFGVLLRTRRDGEDGENFSTLIVDSRRAILDTDERDIEWSDQEGRTTVTHHTFLPPTHWRWINPKEMPRE